ncbi:MAG TPA: aminotransferase class V-fold PLP-dependent enzyme [Bryobacteraceae bacterium]|nr:aminotransferase class V-fold PLP-dependent enzyme [Bryobacteraceae bacterium]
MSQPDWQNIRSEFPALRNRAYLNTATFGQLPRRATEAVAAHWRRRDVFACTDFLSWYDDADRLRASIARLVGASADDIAFVSNAASALGMAIAALDLAPDDNIVTLQEEFPNYLYMPHVREVGWNDLFRSIDAHTRMVAISEVNYSTGFRPPLEEISRFVRERGVILFVDGTQSLGALTIDVGKLGIDIYAAHGYKWLISPTGCGFMAVSEQIRRRLRPIVVGWRSHKTWRDVDNLHHGAPEFLDSAERYEGGGLPFPLLYAMEQSVGLFHEIGPHTVEERVMYLARSARERLRELGAEAADNGSQIVAAKFPGRDPSHLARELKEESVNVAARHGFLRVSPHLYNNEEDLEQLCAALKRLI